MLSTNKLRSIYSKIQTQLFYMIPEKWDRIYLYASIIEQVNHLETGEMFFYYFPSGILKKDPVNVYEIPNKFNIDEEEYLKLVDRLYSTFNQLREAFKESKEEEMWTNLTIIVENKKFNIEYAYDDIFGSDYSNYDRHIVWKCKYLNFPLERLTKKDRKMVEKYNFEKEKKENKIKIYTEPMYKKKVHNIVEFDTQDYFVKEMKNKQEEKIEKIKKKYDVLEEELTQEEGIVQEIIQEAKKERTIEKIESKKEAKPKKTNKHLSKKEKEKIQKNNILRKYEKQEDEAYDYMKNQILNS